MKKNVIIVLIVGIVIGIIIGLSIGKINTHESEDEVVVLGKEKKEQEAIAIDELLKYVTEIKLSKDNWNEFIELKENEEIKKDAFGTVTATIRTSSLVLKNDNYYVKQDSNVALKFKINEKILNFADNHNEQIINIYSTGLTNFYGIKDKSNENMVADTRYSIEDIECIDAIGNIYEIIIPEEYWHENEHFGKVIKVKGDFGENYLSKKELFMILNELK